MQNVLMSKQLKWNLENQKWNVSWISDKNATNKRKRAVKMVTIKTCGYNLEKDIQIDVSHSMMTFETALKKQLLWQLEHNRWSLLRTYGDDMQH